MSLSNVSIVHRECVMVTRISEEGPATAATTVKTRVQATKAEENNASGPAEATPLLTVRALHIERKAEKLMAGKVVQY